MFHYLHVTAGTLPQFPKLLMRHSVLIIQEMEVSDEFRSEVSRLLAETNCVWMMAWGLGCSEWDDSVDWANIVKYTPGPIPEESFIVTTWHENETLKETMEFGIGLTDHMGETIETILVLDINATERCDSIEELFRSAGSE